MKIPLPISKVAGDRQPSFVSNIDWRGRSAAIELLTDLSDADIELEGMFVPESSNGILLFDRQPFQFVPLISISMQRGCVLTKRCGLMRPVTADGTWSPRCTFAGNWFVMPRV